jgi:Flagellar motor switch/type III secretory pathway protein
MNAQMVNAIELTDLIETAAGEKGPGLGERLDLVGHVKVKLAVTLGSAELTLDRLFSLAKGDTVSLDREVDEPVDIRLHDKLIARGQLVAAGDQFGVRITEILAE